MTDLSGGDIVRGEHDDDSSAKRVLQVDETGAAVTPPAAITNYSKETGGNLATVAGAVADSGATLPTKIVAVGGGTNTLTSPVTGNIVPAAVLGNDADGRGTTASGTWLVRAYHYIFNGTTWDRARGDTTNGIWVNIKNAVSLALAAGSAIIGKVGIDQTTDGTTNKVYVGNSPSDSVVAATFVTKTVDFTASQTAQTIWTPASGKKFAITDYDLSFSAAGAITVFDGTDSTTYRVFKMNGAANGGAIHAYKKPRISAAADSVLKYTTGSGAAGSLTINGYEA
jgi:hypothetical protein